MALPVMKPERRRSPRISLSGLAYINFDSNCGGIVVNISDEGLCFHTIAPIERSDTVRFWFLTNGRRIEAEGRLMWTDETRKTGGLRFNALSTEASRQIRNWIVQSSQPFPATTQTAALPPWDATARSSINKPQKSVVHGPAARKESSRWVGTPARWGEFSRGLATGILIALVVAAIFLFHTYKHRIGESLIFLGERFGATAHSEPAAAAPTSASSQVAGPVLQREAAAPAAIPASASEEAMIQPTTKAAKPRQPKLAPKPVTPPFSFAPSPAALPLIDFAAVRPGPPPTEVNRTTQPESADRAVDKTTVMAVKATGKSAENAEDIAEINSGVPFGRYFDVGRFSDEFGARSASDDLARIGIHAIVTQKRRLWINSYQVIAGPYRDPGEMQVASTNLHSHGFKTHSLPRRSRDLTLVSSTAPHGLGEAPAEQFVVDWETYSPEATVNFVKAGYTVAKAQGKWIRRSTSYDYDAIVFEQNGNGSRTLLEIRFHGMNRAVVLPTASPNHSVTF
jgi:hypothetical protein